MSYWYEPKLEDITFSDDGKEMYIWLESDMEGNRYASVKVEDIKKSLEKLDKKE